MENDVRFVYVSWKNVWFCFISIVWVHFIHKNFDFKSHWNTLIFLIKKMSDLYMSFQTVPDLVEALLFVLNFGNKLRNTNFKLFWNSLIFFR